VRVRSRDYGPDVLAASRQRRPTVPSVDAAIGLVVEEVDTGFTGAVVELARDAVTLEDRYGRCRVFPLTPAGFAVDGAAVTLVRPKAGPAPARRTASGSIAVANAKAKVAAASRIYVEGRHDAELVEKVWGDDLRVEGVVVEALDGIDELAAVVRNFGPGPGRRLGVLVDHLVPGSKESRLVAAVRSPYVLVTGHPYIDIWAAVRPRAVRIAAWPQVPPGQPWKEGVCAELGEGLTPPEMWRRVMSGVRTYADVETPLLGAVERLIDFVTEADPRT
jgi:hypothetical protein